MNDQDENQNVISETPDEYKGLHKVLMGVAIFFFGYLILESILIIPTLFIRYGFH